MDVPEKNSRQRGVPAVAGFEADRGGNGTRRLRWQRLTPDFACVRNRFQRLSLERCRDNGARRREAPDACCARSSLQYHAIAEALGQREGCTQRWRWWCARRAWFVRHRFVTLILIRARDTPRHARVVRWAGLWLHRARLICSIASCTAQRRQRQ
jgi:hypothetical protein